MNKGGAGILTLAIIVAMIAGSGPRSVPAQGTRANLSHSSSDRASSAFQRRRATAKQCATAAGTFEFDLIEAVRLSFSEGPDNQDSVCPEAFHIEPNKKDLAHVVFAIVPDPVHTNLSLFFDRQMDAIQQGIMESGWGFERALMPWDNKDHPEPSDFHLRVQQELFEAQEQDQPGLLIFRHAPDTTDKNLGQNRLFVFVIAESPTGGIRKTQFRNAVALVKKFFERETPKKLAILGPTFSGSLQSLASLLACTALDDFPCTVRRGTAVYSGTITGRSSIDQFTAATRMPLYTLQENDDYVLDLFFKFAECAWDYSARHIAILSEEESLYGTKGIVTNDPQIQNKQRAGSGRVEMCRAGATIPTNQEEAVRISFPREISQLRSAYQRSFNGQVADDKAPRATLPLDLESGGNDDDTVRQYSRRQLPLSQEAILLGIVRELQDHDTKIILLRASDPLDQLFLSRYLRQAYPDGRIITFSSDLLFAREVEDARLHGVMALTTYSLTPSADHKFLNESLIHSDRVFPSTDSVGTYNAIKLLLASIFKIGEPEAGCHGTNQTLPCLHLFQYAWPDLPGQQPSVSLAPPVYLTALGHEGYWQVTTLPLAPLSQNPATDNGISRPAGSPASTLPRISAPTASKEGGNREEFSPLGWNVLWFIVVGSSLSYVYFIWTASIFSGSQAVAQLAPPQHDSRRYLLAGAAFLHFSLVMVILWPYEYGIHYFKRLPLAVPLATLFVVAISGCYDLIRRNCWRQAILFIFACIFTVFALRFTWHNDHFHVMSMYRSVHLLSGVSHLLSLLLFLAAAMWGVWYVLSGSSLLDSRRSRLPKSREIPYLGVSSAVKQRVHSCRSILEEDQSRLIRLLRADTLDWRTVAICGFIIGPVFVYTRGRLVRAIEPGSHELLLGVLAACIFSFLMGCVLRLFNIWNEFRRLLIALDSFPLRRGFKRLKGFSWSPLWRLGSGNLGDFHRLVTREAEALRCVFNLEIQGMRALADPLKTQTEHAQTKYDQAWDHFLAKGQFLTPANPGRVAAPEPSPGELSRKPTAFSALVAWAKRMIFFPIALKQWLYKLREQGKREASWLAEFETLQKQFATVALHALATATTTWDEETTLAYEVASSNESLQARNEVPSGTAVRQDQKPIVMRDALEQFLALVYTTFIMVVLVRARALIIAAGGMYVLFLLALTTYPFQPQMEIRMFLFLLLIFMVAVVGIVFAQMHRDTTLSHITDTEPGQLGSSFWLRLASFVAFPVFSLLASQYPEIGNFLFSWLEPSLHALK
ncbi:MAG TPA: hypothetical protein VHA33_19435 [Candidatus Angelobacter sp.]|jgi:hypothetical protein|nr:hypothetical protein [Candidatus Angelobacter sp.]